MSQVKIKLQNFKPFIPILKEYFGFPYVELELDIMALELEENPDNEASFDLEEYVSHNAICGLAKKHFDGVIMSAELLDTLYFAANLYYYRNVLNYEYAQEVDNYGQMELSIMREEIAELYSFLQRLHVKSKNGSGRPVTLKVDKEKIAIPNTLGWLYALLENHLFPNCLPDVKNDDEARSIWDRRKKSGRPSRVEINAIVHGVAKLLHDQNVVNDIAPAELCEFIRDLLMEMGQIHDETDKLVITPDWIKSQIHRTDKQWDGPGFHNTVLRSPTLEELTTVTPDQQAYLWLFNPERK